MIDIPPPRRMYKREIIGKIQAKNETDGAYLGVPLSVALKHGFGVGGRTLTPEKAYEILSAEYWDSIYADLLLPLAPDLAGELVDISVNQSPAMAVACLQSVIAVAAGAQLPVPVTGSLSNSEVSALSDLVTWRQRGNNLLALVRYIRASGRLSHLILT